MKKLVAWVLVLVLLCVGLTGCGEKRTKESVIRELRTQNSDNDKVKFYNLDWLSTKEELEDKIDEEAGEDTYDITYQIQTNVNDKIEILDYSYHNKDNDKPLMKIGGYDVESLYVKYIHYKSDEKNSNLQYLYEISINYMKEAISDNMVEDIHKQLKDKYIEKYYAEQYEYEIGGRFKDENNNEVYLGYTKEHNYKDSNGEMSHINPHFYLKYTCYDIDEYCYNERNKQKEKNNSNGL